ncbi:MAG: helix-turn-helix transcriptional regulator [Parvularculaceae bacterium]
MMLRDETPDHALGQYRAWRAPFSKASALDLAWTNRARSNAPQPHRLLPHGEPSIAIVRRRETDGTMSDIDLLVCGPYHRTKFYAPEKGEELIAWRIKPELAASLFGVSPFEYANIARVSAPQHLKTACQQSLICAEHAPAAEIIRTLYLDLETYADGNSANAGPECAAAQWLREESGKIRFKQIAEKLGISERNLRRRFTDHVGLAPKSYSQQLQLTNAALAAEKEAAPDWAEIAFATGFHDQAHMINLFKSETGLTPGALHAERRDLL